MSTKIEWCQETINPLPGCSKISEGCQNCYAIRMANRFRGTPKYHGLVEHGNWTGRLNYWAADLEKPLRWKKPRRIFVNSMGDLFHPAIDVDGQAYDAIMHMVRRCSRHTFLFLTKRPGKMRWVCERIWGNDLPKNAWFGVTAENQRRADERIPILLQIPAAVRFVSVEPMLGPISLPRVNFHCDLCDGTGILSRWPKGACHYCNGRGEIPAISTDPQFGKPSTPARKIHWVICGGESGPGARPMNPEWARSLKDQCVAAGVPFLLKQLGEYCEVVNPSKERFVFYRDGKRPEFGYGMLDVNRPHIFIEKVGKKAAGRKIDGLIWDKYPVN